MKDERHLHHMWCNHYIKPREGCRMCDDFFKRFPVGDNMVADHFPSATVIPAEGSKTGKSTK